MDVDSLYMCWTAFDVLVDASTSIAEQRSNSANHCTRTPSQLLVHFSRSTIILLQSQSQSQSHTHTRKHTHMHTQSEIKAPSTRPQPHGHLPNQILSPHSSSLLLLPTCRLLLQRHHTYIKIKNLENLTYCFTNILDERLVTMAILKALRRNLIFRQTRKHRFSQALFTIPLSRCKICTLFSPGIKSDKVRRAGLRMFK